MSRAQGINTDVSKVLGLMLSNGLVALSSALLAQYQGFADVNMGRGAIVIGLAAVIIGEAIFGRIFRNFALRLVSVAIGSILYYLVLQVVIWMGNRHGPSETSVRHRRSHLPCSSLLEGKILLKTNQTGRKYQCLRSRTYTRPLIREPLTRKLALDGLSLTLKEGDFVTVIGGNGAGKSTMLNAVAGTWLVDEGQILIDGIDVTKLPEHKRAAYLGRVFQDPMTGTAATMEIEEILALAKRRG